MKDNYLFIPVPKEATNFHLSLQLQDGEPYEYDIAMEYKMVRYKGKIKQLDLMRFKIKEAKIIGTISGPEYKADFDIIPLIERISPWDCYRNYLGGKVFDTPHESLISRVNSNEVWLHNPYEKPSPFDYMEYDEKDTWEAARADINYGLAMKQWQAAEDRKVDKVVIIKYEKES